MYTISGKRISIIIAVSVLLATAAHGAWWDDTKKVCSGVVDIVKGTYNVGAGIVATGKNVGGFMANAVSWVVPEQTLKTAKACMIGGGVGGLMGASIIAAAEIGKTAVFFPRRIRSFIVSHRLSYFVGCMIAGSGIAYYLMRNAYVEALLAEINRKVDIMRDHIERLLHGQTEIKQEIHGIKEAQEMNAQQLRKQLADCQAALARLQAGQTDLGAALGQKIDDLTRRVDALLARINPA